MTEQSPSLYSSTVSGGIQDLLERHIFRRRKNLFISIS